MIRIIADTHNRHSQLSIIECDLLIVAGDMTSSNIVSINHDEYTDFYKWLIKYPAKNIIMVAGNHDYWIYKNTSRIRKELPNHIHYLEDDYITLLGYKIYGSPWTPDYGKWCFMKDRSKINKTWNKIPEDIDILITHGPPKGILDLTVTKYNKFELVGDSALGKKVSQIKPKLHCFGHVHNNKKNKNQGILIRDNITYINASCVTDSEFDKGLSSDGVLLTNNLKPI